MTNWKLIQIEDADLKRKIKVRFNESQEFGKYLTKLIGSIAKLKTNMSWWKSLATSLFWHIQNDLHFLSHFRKSKSGSFVHPAQQAPKISITSFVGRALAPHVSSQAQQNTPIGRGYALMLWVFHPSKRTWHANASCARRCLCYKGYFPTFLLLG